MSTVPGFIDNTTADAATVAPSALWKDKILPSFLAVALGSVMLYGAAFASVEALHNAAHDSRHSAGFPCH